MSRIVKTCGVTLPDASDLFRARYRQLRAQRGAEFAGGDAEYWSCYGEDLASAIAKAW
jgi:hypothetical protein